MLADSIVELRAAVRDVLDFPKAGIVFKDITPILNSGKLFRASIDDMQPIHLPSKKARRGGFGRPCLALS